MGNALRTNPLGTYEQAGRANGDVEQGVEAGHDQDVHDEESDYSSEGESEGEGERAGQSSEGRGGVSNSLNVALNSLVPPSNDTIHEWSTQRLVAHPPKVHHTRTVKCDVNLSRETLRLIPIAEVISSLEGDREEGSTDEATSSGATPSKYQLQFNFAANLECRVKVFFIAREKRDNDNHLVGYTSAYDLTCPPPALFPVGLKQQYFQPLSHPFDVSLYAEKELAYDPDTQTFPIIIVLEPSGATSGEQKERISSQTTFATLLKCTDGSYVIKPVKVKIEFRGATYVVHDIFGLDKDAHGDMGKECVVCMTDQRDTVVLPCRHMCLCRACAEVLRYQTTKCPICRSTFTSLLKIEVSKDRKKELLDSDEEPLKKKRGKGKKVKKDKERVKDAASSSSSEASAVVNARATVGGN